MTTCPLGLGEQCYCASKKISFSSQPSGKTAVLLTAHGSPDNPDNIPEFLKYVTAGWILPPAVVEEQFAEQEGMRRWRAESLNGSRTLTAALAELVKETR